MDKQQFSNIFIKKIACLAYNLSERENNYGWIGGNAPKYFDNKQNLINENNCKYNFFMSFVNPIDGNMLSVFIPKFEIYNYHKIYPDCLIKVIEHEKSQESELNLYKLFEEEPLLKKTEYQKKFDYRIPTIKKTFIDKPEYILKSYVEESFLQIGGNPYLIQDVECYYKRLEEDHYGFFCSINEDGYLENTIHGNDPFCYGTLYLYTQFSESKMKNIVAGFWQN
jgi:hypothetical protein